MSLKGSNTKSKPIKWEDVDKLFKCAVCNKQYGIAAIIIAGSYFGLKVNDSRNLTWYDVLSDSFDVKCNNGRIITIENKYGAKDYFNLVYKLINKPDLYTKIAISTKKMTFSVQRINVLLKEIKNKVGLDYIGNFSTETLRKTFAKHIFDLLPNGFKTSGVEMLRQYLSHSNIEFTMDYLGITNDDLDYKFNSPFDVLEITNETDTTVPYITKDDVEKYKTPSYVYLMVDANLEKGIVKIGKSNNVGSRERTLQGEKPTINLYKYVELKTVSDAFLLEKKLHKRYDKTRIRGEWFKLSDKQMKDLLNEYKWIDVESKKMWRD